MIIIKKESEIALMRIAGKCVSKCFQVLKENTIPGISTLELDELANKTMVECGCKSASKGYYGYPGAICISVNDTLIHGIPSEDIILKEGDIVSYDIVASYKGYNADATRTYIVGEAKEEAKKLVLVTEQSFWNAVSLIKEGIHLSDVSHAIQEYNERHGYTLPREYTGHGIGKEMHEDPYIPNYGKAGNGPILKAGMTLAIEPMVAMGKPDTRVLPDGWTVKMRDHKLCAHYENTIVVTKDGYEVLTTYEGEEIHV